MAILTEDDIEQIALGWFQQMGWTFADPLNIGPDGKTPERGSNSEVVLRKLSTPD